MNASIAVFAQSVELPVLKVMAEPEMRQETGFIPYQERKSEQRALQHRMMQIEDDLQNNPMRGLEIMLQPFRNESGQIQWDLGKVSLGTLETQALREIDFSQPVTTTPRLRIN